MYVCMYDYKYMYASDFMCGLHVIDFRFFLLWNSVALIIRMCTKSERRRDLPNMCKCFLSVLYASELR